MTSRGPADLVRRWVSLYTRGLPADVRDGRRDEIEADLWSQFDEAAPTDRPDRSLDVEILIRLLAGIPADLTWRLEHRGERDMSTATSVRVTSSGALAIGLATFLAGIALAGVFAGYGISARTVPLDSQYYSSGPGASLWIIASASELLLGLALFGYAGRYGDRFARPVTVLVGIGGMASVLAAVGAYTLIVIVPIATVVLALGLVRAHVISGWLAVLHIVAAVVFTSTLVALLGPNPPRTYDLLFIGLAWPLTLAAIGAVVLRGERQPNLVSAI